MTERDPQRTRPVVTAVIAITTLVSLAAVLAGLVGRTLVPFAIEGTVVSIDERNRDPGTEVWIVNMADGTRWFTDEAGARAFRPGVASKAPWSRHVHVGSTDREIALSRDLLGPGIWALLTTGLIGLALWWRSRPARAHTSPPCSPLLSPAAAGRSAHASPIRSAPEGPCPPS